jgi:hypothetical protein
MSIIVDRIKKIAIPEKVTKGSGSKIIFILILLLGYSSITNDAL